MLAACAEILPDPGRNPWDDARVAALGAPEDVRLAGLYAGYLRLAREEKAEFDWGDVAIFLEKAEQAAGGTLPAPVRLAERSIDPGQQVELKVAEAEMMRLLTSEGAALRAPAELARLQVDWDCWLQEAEEEHQSADIAACRAAFEKSLAEAKAKAQLPDQLIVVLPEEDGSVGGVVISAEGAEDLLLDKPFAAGTGSGEAVAVAEGEVQETFSGALSARPVPPAFFVVLFDTGSARLDAAAEAVVTQILSDVARRPVAEIVLAGHTDALGPDGANLRLSRRRAAAVGRAVSDRLPDGAKVTVEISARGEEVPAIPSTGAEPGNRRVEVTVR